MDSKVIALAGIQILIYLMIIGMGMVFCKGYGADFLTFFDEKRHDREKISKLSGRILIIGGVIQITIVLVDCFLS